MHKLPPGATIIATSVVAPFTVPFKLALLLAVGIAMPFRAVIRPGRSWRPGCTSTKKSLPFRCSYPACCCFTWVLPSPTTRCFPVMLSFFVANHSPRCADDEPTWAVISIL